MAGDVVNRLTLIVLGEGGRRDKHPLQSLVGVPRKGELFWLGDDPYVVVEVEYAATDGLFGGKTIEAAGVYVRALSEEEQQVIAQRLTVPARGASGGQVPFRP
jgi:hypothetical protein